MKKLIDNVYANFYLNAADTFGLTYSIHNEKMGLATITKGDKTLDISSIILGLNSQLSGCLSENKVKTSTLLHEQNIPVPKFQTFEDPEHAIAFGLEALHEKKSVVIKPISGSLSIGITVSPASLTQIKSAVKEAFIGNSEIMIEEYIPGRHFRITVLDDEVIAITERIGANVEGDGKSTVLELIAQKNVQRKKEFLPEIYLRKKDLEYLKNEKIELLKIYPKGVSITLQLGCDLDIGGERVRIDRNLIPKVNSELFINAIATLGLRFGGIDFITPDITIPYTTIPTAINEINSCPDSDVHFRDTSLHSNYAAERIIEKIFFGKTDSGLKIKVN